MSLSATASVTILFDDYFMKRERSVGAESQIKIFMVLLASSRNHILKAVGCFKAIVARNILLYPCAVKLMRY